MQSYNFLLLKPFFRESDRLFPNLTCTPKHPCDIKLQPVYISPNCAVQIVMGSIHHVYMNTQWTCAGDDAPVYVTLATSACEISLWLPDSLHLVKDAITQQFPHYKRFICSG